jgi:2-keto-4-pentenoate hydratase/2-oxohepta-3-ene-1,7-dioic acid hydratase in catechol pathway
MKLGTIEWAGQAVPVCFAAQGILDLRAALPAGSAAATTLLDLIAGGQAVALGQRVQQMAAAGELAPLPADGVKPLAPIPRTARNVFCLGRNYADHIQEDNVSRDKQTPPPEYPQFFTKPSSAIVGDGAAIRYDERVTRRLDYEVELAVVIGTGGRDINAADALKHVLGYTIVNDVTARDLQRRHDQWFKGKGLDTLLPHGPVDRDGRRNRRPTRAATGPERQRRAAPGRKHRRHDFQDPADHRVPVRRADPGAR